MTCTLISARQGRPHGFGLPAVPRQSSARTFCAKKRVVSQRRRESRLVVHAGVVEESRHALPDGMTIEILKQKPDKESNKPPIVFVHGSYHGAWCWKENFLPFFSENGYPSYAISLRGQGNSDKDGLEVSGNIFSHTKDVASFVGTLESAPILVCHSFSGLIAQNFALMDNLPEIKGVACLCCVPPSGNNAMVARFLKRDVITSLKITWSFVTKSFARSLDACRETFFSPDIPQEDLERYQRQLAQCSPIPLLDLRALQNDIPLPKPTEKMNAFVLGADNDYVVDKEAIEETAEWFGTDYVMIANMAHDCMLDTRWRNAAENLKDWLDAQN